MTPPNTPECADSICSAFQKALRSGHPTDIEDCLQSFSGLQRPRLFTRLLEIELAVRTPVLEVDAEEYIARFPEFAALVESVFQKYAPTTIDDIETDSVAQAADFSESCPLFSVVPAEILQRYTTEESFRAGAFLIRQNAVGDSLMVIRQGSVEITIRDSSGESCVIDQSGPGDIIGEMSLLTSELRTASVQAIDDVQALRLSSEAFHQLAKAYPDLSVILTALVAARLEKPGPDALTEKVLHGHRILRQLGKGSMGIVYEAEDLTQECRVALKMMSHRLVYSQEAHARFQQEADLIQSLRHPNIVRSYSRFGAFHTCFLAMEYCEGRNLHDLILEESPLSEDLCRRIIGDIAAAIHYAHQNDVVHLDLKPANVMVGDDGHAKLMDFGLAELVSETLKPNGAINGTVRYMPPEQRVGAVRNCRADYFALGCVAWEMFAGKPLFTSSIRRELVRDFSGWEPPDWTKARDGLNPGICNTLRPALAADPADRNLDLEHLASWSGG